MRLARCLASIGLAIGLGCRSTVSTAPSPAPDCTYDRCALWMSHGPGSSGVVAGSSADSAAGFTFVPWVEQLATANPDVARHHRAARRNFWIYTVIGLASLAPYLATVEHYFGKERPRSRAAGIWLPVTTVGLAWLGNRHASKGDNHLRQAMWLYNRHFADTAAPTECPYDACALRIQSRTASTWLVQGAAATPLARMGRPWDLLAAGGDSARFHYEAYREIHRSDSAVRAIVLGSLAAAVAVFAATDRDDDIRAMGFGFLVVGYAVGHGTVYSNAAAATHLDQAIWHYNRRFARTADP